MEQFSDDGQRDSGPKKVKGSILFLRFALPWFIGFLWILSLYLLIPGKTFMTLGFWMLVYFFPPFGKETVIPLAIAGDRLKGAVPFDYPPNFVPIEPWLIAIAVASLDILAGLFMIWNFDYAKKIPILGKWIEKTEKKGSTVISERRSIEVLSFVGIVLFVMFPFQGTGGVGASILGRVIGMKPYELLCAIAIGAIVGCFLIAYAAATFLEIFLENPIIGAVILLIFIVTVVFILRRRKNQNKTTEDQ